MTTTTTPVNQIRQGDVLLQRVAPPAGVTRTTEQGLLVPGERTGHAHRLAAEVWQDNTGRRFLRLDKPRPIVHTEEDEITQADHLPVLVPAGWWIPVLQRQYVPGGRPGLRARWD